MHRLEDAGPAVAEARRGREPEAAAHAGRDVGEDVAERVLGQDHVEPLRALDELHSRRVDEHVLELDVRIVGRDAHHRLAPEPRGLEHVRLVHGGDVRPPRSGELERAPRDPLDRLRRVLAGVEGRAVRTPAAGAVVEAADELADDQQVDARRRWRDGGSRRRRARARRAIRPCSGRTGAPSSSGRPTAPRMTASAALARCERPLGQRRALRRGSRRRRSCAPRPRPRAGGRGGRRSRPPSPPGRFRRPAGRRRAASATELLLRQREQCPRGRRPGPRGESGPSFVASRCSRSRLLALGVDRARARSRPSRARSPRRARAGG